MGTSPPPSSVASLENGTIPTRTISLANGSSETSLWNCSTPFRTDCILSSILPDVSRSRYTGRWRSPPAGCTFPQDGKLLFASIVCHSFSYRDYQGRIARRTCRQEKTGALDQL